MVVPATDSLGGDEMPTLSIDIETFSEVDLPKAGVYAYTDSDTFEILLFAYAFDDEPTQIVDLKCGERLPRRVLEALTDPEYTKTAFNAAQTRPALIIGVNIGLALKPRCIQKQPVFPVHAATQASWNWSRLASPKLEEKAPYFCF